VRDNTDSFEEIVAYKRQIIQLKKQITINNKEIERFKPVKEKQMKQVIQLARKIQRLEKQNEKNTQLIKQLTKQIKQHNNKTETPFDDELMQNMETTDILMTDTNYTPPSQIEDNNNFRRDVLNNIKNIKYNPTKEKQKYSYDKLEQMRSERL
jgi:hypothetical protein